MSEAAGMRMRWGCLVTVVLLGGCQRAPPPEPGVTLELPAEPSKGAAAVPAATTPAASPPLESPTAGGEASSPPAQENVEPTWSARSADGRAEVRQALVREGPSVRCQSTAIVTPPGDAPSVVWTWNTCLATRSQRVFVSPDGKHVLVLDPLPASRLEDWRSVEVATLYEHGVRMKSVQAGAIVGAPEVIREPLPRFAWVKGEGGVEGLAPRYSSDGNAVELDTVEGKTLRWGFTGEGFPAQAEEAHAFVAAEGMYWYEDERKTTHFVSSLDEVPHRYRLRALPVKSSVTVIAGKGPMTGVEPPPSPPEPPPPAPAPGKDAPVAKGPLPEAEVPNPAELVQKARDAVKKVNEAQRDQETRIDSMK